MIMKSPATRNLWLCWDSLQMKDGLLYKKHPTSQNLCLIVPTSLQDEVMDLGHSCLLSGHLGYKKTLARLSQRFYWFNIREKVRNWVRKCTICAANTRPHKKAKAPLGRMTVGAPLDRIGMDLSLIHI